MKRNFIIALLIALFLLASVGGVGYMTSYARDSVSIGDVVLPPRPSPNPKITPAPPASPLPDLPDLSIGLIAYPSEAIIGDRVMFTINLVNPEKIKARGVDVLGLIPDVFDVLDITTTHGDASFNSRSHNVKTSIRPLPPETSVTIIISARVNPQAVIGTTYYTAARVFYGKQPDTRQFFSNWVAVSISGE
ncbi:MAG: DUF11 domain-containing protein [Chloroflexi bacterium]|nr:DUF11 domain-containing protein [Chloroflexota bacterium]